MILFKLSAHVACKLLAENRLIFKAGGAETPARIIAENKKLNATPESVAELKNKNEALKDKTKETPIESDYKKERSLSANLKSLMEKVYEGDPDKNNLSRRHAADLLFALHEQMKFLFKDGITSFQGLVNWGTYKISKISLENGQLKFYDEDNNPIKFNYLQDPNKPAVTAFGLKSSWEGKSEEIITRTQSDLKNVSVTNPAYSVNVAISAEKDPSFSSNSSKKHNSTVEHLQSLLTDAGFNAKSNIDGRWGSRTETAFNNFQTEWNRLNPGNQIVPFETTWFTDKPNAAAKEDKIKFLNALQTYVLAKQKPEEKAAPQIKIENPVDPAPVETINYTELSKKFNKTANLKVSISKWNDNQMLNNWNEIDYIDELESVLKRPTFKDAFTSPPANFKENFLGSLKNKNSDITLNDVVVYISSFRPYGLTFKNLDELKTIAANPAAERTRTILKDCLDLLSAIDKLAFDEASAEKYSDWRNINLARVMDKIPEESSELSGPFFDFDDIVGKKSIKSTDNLKITITKEAFEDFNKAKNLKDKKTVLKVLFSLYTPDTLIDEGCLKKTTGPDGKEVLYIDSLPSSLGDLTKNDWEKLNIHKYKSPSSHKTGVGPSHYRFSRDKIDEVRESLLDKDTDKIVRYRLEKNLSKKFDRDTPAGKIDNPWYRDVANFVKGRGPEYLNEYKLQSNEAEKIVHKKGRIPALEIGTSAIFEDIMRQVEKDPAQGQGVLEKYLEDGLQYSFLHPNLNPLTLGKKILDDKNLQTQWGIEEKYRLELEEKTAQVKKSQDSLNKNLEKLRALEKNPDANKTEIQSLKQTINSSDKNTEGSVTHYQTASREVINFISPYLANELTLFFGGNHADLSEVMLDCLETGYYADILSKTSSLETITKALNPEEATTVQAQAEKVAETKNRGVDLEQTLKNYDKTLKDLGIDLNDQEKTELANQVNHHLESERQVGHIGVAVSKNGLEAAGATVNVPLGKMIADLHPKSYEKLAAQKKQTLLEGLSLDVGAAYVKGEGAIAIFNPTLKINKFLTIQSGLLTNFGDLTASLNILSVNIPLNNSGSLELAIQGGAVIDLKDFDVGVGAGVGLHRNLGELSKKYAKEINDRNMAQFLSPEVIQAIDDQSIKIAAEIQEKIGDKASAADKDTLKKAAINQMLVSIARDSQVHGPDQIKGIINGAGVGAGLGFGGFYLGPYLELNLGHKTYLYYTDNKKINFDKVMEAEDRNKFTKMDSEQPLPGESPGTQETLIIPASKVAVGASGQTELNPNDEAYTASIQSVQAGLDNASKTNFDADKFMTDLSAIGVEASEISAKEGYKAGFKITIKENKGDVDLFTQNVEGLTVERTPEKGYSFHLYAKDPENLHISRRDRHSLVQTESGKNTDTTIIIRGSENYKSREEISKEKGDMIVLKEFEAAKKVKTFDSKYTAQEKSTARLEKDQVKAQYEKILTNLKEYNELIKREAVETQLDQTQAGMFVNNLLKKHPDFLTTFRELTTIGVDVKKGKESKAKGVDYDTIIQTLNSYKDDLGHPEPFTSTEISAILLELLNHSFFDKRTNIIKQHAKNYDKTQINTPAYQKALLEKNPQLQAAVNKEFKEYFVRQVAENPFIKNLILNFFKSKTSDAEAKKFAAIVINDLLKADMDPTDIEAGTVMMNGVGKDNVTGLRYFVFPKEKTDYRTLVRAPYKLNDPDPDRRAIAKIILEQGSPLPEDPEKFLNSPLTLALRSIAPIIFKDELADSIKKMYSQPQYIDQSSYQIFRDLVLQVREAQKNGQPVLDLNAIADENIKNALNTDLFQLIIHFEQTNAYASLYEQCVNPTFNLSENINLEVIEKVIFINLKVTPQKPASRIDQGPALSPYLSRTGHSTLKISVLGIQKKEEKKPDESDSGDVTQGGNTEPGIGEDGGDDNNGNDDNDNSNDHGDPPDDVKE